MGYYPYIRISINSFKTLIISPSFPQQTLDDIEQGTQTITSRDVLQASISWQEQLKLSAMQGLMEIYADTIEENADHQALVNLLQAADEPRYRYQLIDYHLNLGNTSAAQQVLNGVSNIDFSEVLYEEYMDMQSYYQVLIDALSGEGDLKSLSGSVLSTLETLSNSDHPRVAARARGLLRLNEVDPEYVAQVYWPVGASYKKAPSGEAGRPKKPSSQFKVYPNPSDGRVVLQWNWFEAGMASPLQFKVYDMRGTIVWQHELPEYKDNSFVIQAGALPPGVYLLEIGNGEKTLEKISLSITQ